MQRQVEEELNRLRTTGMSYARKYPKLHIEPDLFSYTFNRFMHETNLDSHDALRLLSECHTLIHEDIPQQILNRYLTLDWSVLPYRTAIVLMVLLELQFDDGTRMLAPPWKIIARARHIESNMDGWKISPRDWSPRVVMDAYRLLKKLGLIDELTVGTSGGSNDWDGYYSRVGRRKATIISLTSHPHQPTTRIRGHLRPTSWSIMVHGQILNHIDITPTILRASPKVKNNTKTEDTGNAVCKFEIPAPEPMTLTEMQNYLLADELQTHGHLRGLYPGMEDEYRLSQQRLKRRERRRK